MPVTNYYMTDGQMIGYDDGTQKDLFTDALGSVTGEVNQAGGTTFQGRYKPYAGDLSSAGARGSFGWVGTWGYRETCPSGSSFYVRARHYSKLSGSWTTVDSFWPNEAAYEYAESSPVSYVDPDGNQGCYPGPYHGIPTNEGFPGHHHGEPSDGCTPAQRIQIAISLNDLCTNRIPNITTEMKACLQKRCNNIVIQCLPGNDPVCKDGQAGHTPKIGGRVISLCPGAWDSKKYCCLGKTILHEMCHTCGSDRETLCEKIAQKPFYPGSKPCP